MGVMEEELVDNKKWITAEDMLDMLVVAESTPGVMAVNTATSVGYRLRGVIGAIIATFGVVLPSFLIITSLSFAINALQDNVWYTAAFTGVQACVTVLVLNALLKIAGQLDFSFYNVFVAMCAFIVATFTNIDVIFLILIGLALGILIGLFKGKSKQLPLKNAPHLCNEDCDDAQKEGEK